MKIAKLTNVTTVEAAGIVVHLGGRVLFHHDGPLLNLMHVMDVCNHFEASEADSIFFDTGAIFDRAAYGLARDAVDAIVEKHPDRLKVVIFNAPDYGRRKEATADAPKAEV